MNLSIIKISLLIFSLLFITSCTDVVDVTTPDGGERLVVEASILWEKGTDGSRQTIKLSTSTPFFEENTNNPVTGATVVVTNNNSLTPFVFEDQNNGEYTAEDFIPELNESYTLEINYNGQTYEAEETLVSVSAIDEIEQVLDEGLEEEETSVKVYFDDPANIENYYLGIFKIARLPLVILETRSDEFTNGNRNFIEYEEENLVVGDSLFVELQGISERYFNYIGLLSEQSEAEDGPFRTIPVQLKGNCINVTTPNEEVLGYFRLSEVSKGQYTIQ
ncbi:MAG: DUF4249 domain-containing protein [Bacteroidota bacterium]